MKKLLLSSITILILCSCSGANPNHSTNEFKPSNKSIETQKELLRIICKNNSRTRMSGADIEAKILEALKNAPHGISQIDSTDSTGVSYASVVNWLKENAAKVRSEGERKGKKVFLK